MTKDYTNAVNALKKAVELASTSGDESTMYGLWNKLGAMYAMLKNIE